MSLKFVPMTVVGMARTITPDNAVNAPAPRNVECIRIAYGIRRLLFVLIAFAGLAEMIRKSHNKSSVEPTEQIPVHTFAEI